MAEINGADSTLGVLKETFIEIKQFLGAAAATARNDASAKKWKTIMQKIRYFVENAADSRSLLVAIGLAYCTLDNKFGCESCQSNQMVAHTEQQKQTELTLRDLGRVWTALSKRILALEKHEELIIFVYFEYIRLWRRTLKRLDEAIVRSATKIDTSPEMYCLFEGVTHLFEHAADVPRLALVEWKALKLYNTFLTVGASNRTTTVPASRLCEAQLQFVATALRVFADEARLSSRFEVVSTLLPHDADAGVQHAASHTSFVYVTPSSNALLRAFVLLVLRVLHFASIHFDSPTRAALDVRASLSLVLRIVTHRNQTGEQHLSRTGLRPFIEQVFVEQDDDFIDCLLLLLEVRRARIVEPHELPEIFKPEIELAMYAESLFEIFVNAFASDVFCVVELLLAPETRALEFVTKCLKCALHDTARPSEAANDSNGAANLERHNQLDAPNRQHLREFVSRVHDKLSTLHQHAQVPFNVTPLLRLMGRYAIKCG